MLLSWPRGQPLLGPGAGPTANASASVMPERPLVDSIRQTPKNRSFRRAIQATTGENPHRTWSSETQVYEITTVHRRVGSRRSVLFTNARYGGFQRDRAARRIGSDSWHRRRRPATTPVLLPKAPTDPCRCKDPPTVNRRRQLRDLILGWWCVQSRANPSRLGFSCSTGACRENSQGFPQTASAGIP